MSGSTWDFVSSVRVGRLGRGFGGGFGNAWRVVARAIRAAGTRRQLTELDDRMLKDLGISRAQAQFEASRSLWDSATRR